MRVVGLCLSALTVANAFPHMKPQPYLFGHRGYSGNFPENTFLSFQGTLDAGGNANELDCYTTADGEYVVIHDSRVDRTTNGTGVVRDYTLEELQELDAGWYKSNDGGSTYPFRGQGVKIQTLMEVFEEITEGLINIDIKESTEEAADLLAKVLDEAGEENRRRVLAGSFDQSTTDYFQSISPTTPTYAGVGEASNFVIRYGLGLGGSFEPSSTFLELPDLPTQNAPDFHRVANDIGYTVIYFTINDTDQARELLLGGADGMMTDNVSQIAEVYRDLCVLPGGVGGNLDNCLASCDAYLEDATEIETCKIDHCGKLC